MVVRQCVLFIYLFMALPLLSQEEDPKHWSLNGYVKQLQTVIKFDGLDNYLLDNLWHNRLNFKYFPSEGLTVVAELRTRMFYGDFVKLTPNYADQIETANNDKFDFSFHLIDKPNWVLNTTSDRFYFQYTAGNFEARLGRQRINWGINTVWNPNDLFNAFAFTDFDYEERPGSDAVRLKYYTGIASSIEVAVNLADTWRKRVAAMLYKFNVAQYDFQFLAGVANQDFVIGGGWAGNIKNSGFKGEWSYFIPTTDSELSNSFALTLAFDHLFSNSIYLNVGYLYNSEGNTGGSLAELFAFELSAKNLYPFRHSAFVSAGYPITPLMNANLALIYSPVSSQPLFLNPTLTYSLAQNWDLDLVGQIAFSKNNSTYTTAVSAGFLRIKLSF